MSYINIEYFLFPPLRVHSYFKSPLSFFVPVSGVPRGGGLEGSNPPEIPKLGQIPRSVENKSVTT
jgi:hypothetical protein